MDTLIIAPVRRQDLDAIMEIEQASFPTPWDILSLFLALDDPQGWSRMACHEGRLVGYCFAHAMRDMLHLLNLAVHNGYRRQGVARRLLEELIEYARGSARLFIFLEVRPSNMQAKALYRAMGFEPVCTWRQYYHDTREDAQIMVKRLS